MLSVNIWLLVMPWVYISVLTHLLVLFSFVMASPRLLNNNRATLHLHVLLTNQKTANDFLNQDGAFGEKLVSFFFQLNVLLILSIKTNELSITENKLPITADCQSENKLSITKEKMPKRSTSIIMDTISLRRSHMWNKHKKIRHTQAQ